MKEEEILNTNIEGIYFENFPNSEICHFSSVINPNGILAFLLDEDGNFKGRMLLNPGETVKSGFLIESQICEEEGIIFGFMTEFDQEGNMSVDYFAGVFCEFQTVIVIREGENLDKPKTPRVYVNPGYTKKINARI